MGELTPEQWNEIQQGLKDIAVLSSTVKHIEEKQNEIEDKVDLISNALSMLKQIIKGSNGDYKTSVLGRLDNIESKEAALNNRHFQTATEKRKAMVRIIVAIISSGFLTTVGSSLMLKLFSGV